MPGIRRLVPLRLEDSKRGLDGTVVLFAADAVVDVSGRTSVRGTDDARASFE